MLIRRVEQEAKTAGGIIIPDTAQEKPMEGEVIAVGPGARGEDGKVHPLDVKAGDRVLFMADGEIVEDASPEQFFTNPTSNRAKDFLSKILTH